VRPRGDVIDPPEALDSDLLVFVMLYADKHLARNAPFVSG
jgi:hypothetical protein